MHSVPLALAQSSAIRILTLVCCLIRPATGGGAPRPDEMLNPSVDHLIAEQKAAHIWLFKFLQIRPPCGIEVTIEDL